MNFLETWNGKKKEITPVNDNRRVMDEALAKLKRRPVELSAPAREREKATEAFAAPPKPVSPETIDQACMCAVWDLPFIYQYEKQSNGRFRSKASIKVHEGRASGGAGHSRSVTLPINQSDQGEGQYVYLPDQLRRNLAHG